MSSPAKTVFVFGCYLLGLGVTLLVLPNQLLALFQFEPTSEVWIRVIGVPVLSLGVYYIVAARSELNVFIQWSVWVRGSVVLFFLGLVLTKLAPFNLLLFGGVDLAAAIWTWMALRKDGGFALAAE